MTAKNIIQDLAREVDRGHIALGSELAGVVGWSSLMKVIGESTLAVHDVKIDVDAATLRGKCTVLGQTDTAMTWAFADADGGVSVSVDAHFDTSIGIAIPGAMTFELERASISIQQPGDGGSAVGAIHAKLLAGALELPIAVHLPAACSGWIIQGNFGNQGIPGLKALADLAGRSGLTEALPADLGNLARSIELSGLEIRCSDATRTVNRISMTVTAEGDWPVIEGHLDIRDPAICFSILRDQKDFAVLVSGVVHIENTPIPICIAREQGAQWSFNIPSSYIPLPTPTILFKLLGERAALPLPEGFGDKGGLGLTRFELGYDAGAKKVSSVSASFEAHGDWRPPFVDFISVQAASISLAADWINGAGLAADVSGTIEIAGEKLLLIGQKQAHQPQWDILQASLRDASLPIQELTSQYLPGVIAPDLNIRTLAVAIEPAARKGSITADIEGPWTIPLGITTLIIDDLSFTLGAEKKNGKITPVGSLHGKASISGATFDLDFALGGELQIETTIPSLKFSDLLKPLGIPQPAILRDVEFKDVILKVAPLSGEFTIAADSDKEWKIPVPGGDLHVKKIGVSVTRTAAGNAGSTTAKGIDCNITLSVGDIIIIPEQLTLDAFTLTFASTSGKAWSASGDLKGNLMDLGIDLSAAYKETKTNSTLTLKSSITSKRDLVSLKHLGSLNVNSFSLHVVSAQTRDDEPPERSWTVASNGSVQLGFAGGGFTSTGSLEFHEAKESMSLEFLPEKALAKIPLDPFPGKHRGPTMLLDFEKIVVKKTTNAGKANWSFEADVDFSFRELPEGLQGHLAKLQPFKTKFVADGRSIELTADPIMEPVKFELPTIQRGHLNLSLGKAEIFARNLSVSLGSEIGLTAEINIGLPSELNHLFGVSKDSTPQPGLFNVYDPAHPNQDLFKLCLGVGTGGVSFQVLTSPFSFLKVEAGYMSWDGLFGLLGLKLPTLELNPKTQSFEIDVELDVQDLKIPLTPLKAVLSAFGFDEVAHLLKESVPFEPLDLFDSKDNDNLRVPEFIAKLKKLGMTNLEETQKILEGLARPIDRLPSGLKRYFKIAIPESFRLHIAITATGSVRFDFSVGEDSDPLRFLIPMIPELVGIELYGFSLGELFGGALLVTSVDARIDQFDLPSIAGSLMLPEKGLPALPAYSQTLQKRIVVDKLFMIIVYETGVPIPLPLFYDELGIEYWGIAGLQFGGHVSLKMPEFNLTGFIQQVGLFKEFFTDKTVFLHPDEPPEGMDIAPSTGPNYIALPNYLGGRELGDRKAVHEVSAYAFAAGFLNTLKHSVLEASKLTINDVIQVVPLEDRVKAGEVTVAGITAGGAYAITTPQEFQAQAYQLLNLKSIKVEDALAVMPRDGSEIQGDDSGLCLFFGGGFDVRGAVTFEAVYALAAVDSHFGTGFGIHGSLASGSVDLALRGVFTIDPKQAMPVGLDGHGHLTVLGQPVLAGDVTLGEQGFHLMGMVDLFPDSPVQFKLNLKGDVGEHDCRFAGCADLAIEQHFTLLGGSFVLDTTQFVVKGTWLDQKATFAIQRFKRQQITVVQFSADLDPISIGELFGLTGGGPQGGPHATLELLEDLSFTLDLSGGIHLLGVKESTAIHITDQGFAFTVTGSLLDLFECQLDVVAGSLIKSDQFLVTGTFQKESIDDIAGKALKLLANAKKEASKLLGQAQQDVTRAEQRLKAAIQSARRQVDDANRRVNDIQAHIGTIDRQVSKLILHPLKNSAEILKKEALRKVYQGELVPANANLAMTEAVCAFATAGKAIVHYVLTPALEAIRQDAEEAKREITSAKERLNAVTRQLGIKAKLAKYRGMLLSINRIIFSAALDDVKGASVTLNIWCKFLGAATPQNKPHQVSCQLESPASIATALVHFLVGP